MGLLIGITKRFRSSGMPIPEDDCPNCEIPMERGITEFGQICPECLFYKDDPYWAMEGEYFDDTGKPVPNPRADELRSSNQDG